MCRSIKPLFNYDPPVTDLEIEQAVTQFVRKVAGFRLPSKTNEQIYNQTIKRVAIDINFLLNNLVTQATKRKRK